MLIESDVIDSVCHVLRRHKFRITSVKRETQHGIDIEAVALNGRRVAVEAKVKRAQSARADATGSLFLAVARLYTTSRMFFLRPPRFGAVNGAFW